MPQVLVCAGDTTQLLADGGIHSRSINRQPSSCVRWMGCNQSPRLAASFQPLLCVSASPPRCSLLSAVCFLFSVLLHPCSSMLVLLLHAAPPCCSSMLLHAAPCSSMLFRAPPCSTVPSQAHIAHRTSRAAGPCTAPVRVPGMSTHRSPRPNRVSCRVSHPPQSVGEAGRKWWGSKTR
jgi:hypothetical protein